MRNLAGPGGDSRGWAGTPDSPSRFEKAEQGWTWLRRQRMGKALALESQSQTRPPMKLKLWG